jgi:molecular chaperone GrpE (heat shock protein)
MVQDDIVIEAMIKGLRPGPATKYFARKTPHSLENLLQKMDEYIRVDNDFRQRREEAQRDIETARDFGGRFHSIHILSIHNSGQNEEKTGQPQGQSK